MTKLSKTQLAILKRMGEGGELEYVGKPLDRFVWAGVSMPRLNKRGIHILEDLGLIEARNKYWWGNTYTITPAGRAYLEENP